MHERQKYLTNTVVVEMVLHCTTLKLTLSLAVSIVQDTTAIQDLKRTQISGNCLGTQYSTSDLILLNPFSPTFTSYPKSNC